VAFYIDKNSQRKGVLHLAEEIQEAIQIIRVAYDGLEIALKVGSGSIEVMKKTIDVMIGLLDHEKAMGKTNMRNLLKKGGDLQVLQFQTQDMKKVEKYARKYGILYSVLPDINKKDGLSEIIFHTEAVPRVNMLIQKLKSGRIATFEEYLKGGDEKELEKLLSFLKKQKQGNVKDHTEEAVKADSIMEGLIEKVGTYAMEKQSISVAEIEENFHMGNTQAQKVMQQLQTIGVVGKGEPDGVHKVVMDKEAFEKRMRKYQELAGRMRTMAAAKNGDMIDITISKKLVAEENSHAVKTRIPFQKDKYIWIAKDKAMDIHDGKTILTFLDKNRDYKIYSADNRVVGSMKGAQLYENSYDPVTAEVRKRYAKAKPDPAKAPFMKKR